MPRRPISLARPFCSVAGISSRRSVCPVGAVSNTMHSHSCCCTCMAPGSCRGQAPGPEGRLHACIAQGARAPERCSGHALVAHRTCLSISAKDMASSMPGIEEAISPRKPAPESSPVRPAVSGLGSISCAGAACLRRPRSPGLPQKHAWHAAHHGVQVAEAGHQGGQAAELLPEGVAQVVRGVCGDDEDLVPAARQLDGQAAAAGGLACPAASVRQPPRGRAPEPEHCCSLHALAHPRHPCRRRRST